jgi:hypothetical protein
VPEPRGHATVSQWAILRYCLVASNDVWVEF